MANFVSKWIRQAARGEECMFRLHGICNYNSETTVFAHSNDPKHGKGLGLKAHDVYGVFACSNCHRFFDESAGKALQQGLFAEAHEQMVQWVRHRLDGREGKKARQWLDKLEELNDAE